MIRTRVRISAPLRSAQAQDPPDLVRSPLRFGRRKTKVPRTLCGPRSAPVGAKPRSPGPCAVLAPLRSAQNQGPPDLVRSSLRSGRRRTKIPRTLCGLRSAPVGAGPRSPGPCAVFAPLRSAQNQGPPDLVRPLAHVLS